jgi:hypothetical protein
MAWTNLRKGVAFLSRDQAICGQCNGRYLDALAHVDDPTPAVRALAVAHAALAARPRRGFADLRATEAVGFSPLTIHRAAHGLRRPTRSEGRLYAAGLC